MKRTSSSEEHSIAFLSRMSEVLRVLAHPQRLKIVEILQAAGRAPVHDIVDRLGATQATTSQHLNQMRRAGVVAAERRGKEVWYEVEDRKSLAILRCLCAEQRAGRENAP